jgi:lipopolysaccharide export system protein LptA
MRSGHRRGHLLALCATTLVIAASAAGALAQPKPPPQQPQASGPPNALQGFSQNRDQPVKINAASLEVQDRSKVATFSGNVRVVQGDTTMLCKTLVVYYDGDNAGPSVKAATPGPAGSQQIRRMVASGGVLVTQKDQTATGDSAVYDMPANTVTLTASGGGLVAVTQGRNIMKGQSLVVDLTTSVSHLKGGPKGGVEGLIIPNDAKGRDTKPAGDRNATPKPAPPNASGLY